MRYCLNYFGTRSLFSTILRKLKLLNFLVDSVLNLRIFSVAQIAFSDFIDKKSIILQVESRGREFLFCSSLVSFGLMGSKLVSQVNGFGGSFEYVIASEQALPGGSGEKEPDFRTILLTGAILSNKKTLLLLGNSPSTKIINWRSFGCSYSVQQLQNNNLPGFIFNVFAKLLPN